MMKKQVRIWLGVLVVAILVTSLAAVSCSAPQNSVTPGDGSQVGIKVHGHWTIDVMNPDGSLAQHREFENALTEVGVEILPRLMARHYSVGGWRIDLKVTNPTNSAFEAEGGTGYIVESSNENTAAYYFKTLAVTAPTSGPNAEKFLLSGTATALRNGTVEQVATYLTLQSPSSPPASTYTGIVGGSVTQTTLPSALSLTSGQQVVVTVIISFS